MTTPRNPAPTVDILIELLDRPHRPLVLVERHYEPLGWAIPGGFVDYGETLAQAARREAQEETGLAVHLVSQFHTYSDPRRDLRQHTIATVFIATATGAPQAGDDAKNVGIFLPWEVSHPLCFDHSQILHDYLQFRYYGLRPQP